jgi:molecular chaperone GrpE
MDNLEPETSASSAETPAETESITPDDHSAQINARLQALETGVGELKQGMQDLFNWLDIIPRGLRQVNNKVEIITSSLNEPRIKNLLNDLLLLYDLLEQFARTAKPESDEARNYNVLLTQIRQALSANGVYAIPQQAQFDPQIHKAIQILPCETPEDGGKIVEFSRQGFRTDHAVLRYAEVVIKQYSEEQP